MIPWGPGSANWLAWSVVFIVVSLGFACVGEPLLFHSPAVSPRVCGSIFP